MASSPPAELDSERFAAAVTAITQAFGDPTRRAIYLFAHEHDSGVTASAVATEFALHANVARHHLDKLAAGGYLEVHIARDRDSGAGRPSKHYFTSGSPTGIELPKGRDDLILRLLGKALGRLPRADAEAIAEETGLEYGRTLADAMSPGDAQRSLKTAMSAVADALTAHGFAAHAEARGSSLQIVADHCPFGTTAQQHPVICAVDRGMVRGLLDGLYGDTSPSTASSRAHGDETCVTEFG
ncbi:MAG TPA: helix-turn-helix domain-containing protein [Acidimicrobiales bacterium]